MPPLPADYSNPGQLLGWMACALFIAVVGAMGVKMTGMGSRSPGGDPAAPQQTIAIPTDTPGQKVEHTVTGIDPSVIPVMQAMAGTIEQMQIRLGSEVEHRARLEARFAGIEFELRVERRYSKILIEHMDDMMTGYSEGRYPPWGDIPTRPAKSSDFDI